ncbi:MAG: Asp23/Gls24 family envelope stress response protein [Anaerolineae bacterium]
MNDEAMSEKHESIGRIEVAPGVLATIVHYATLRVDGVARMASVPSEVARLFRRETRHGSIVLDLSDNKVRFDIYVIMDPHVNIMETSRKLQTAVVEAIDTMVGIPVDAVNVHVEDVVYQQGEAA